MDIPLQRLGPNCMATIEIFGDYYDELSQLYGKPLDVEIKPHRNRRSLSANALCWQLCSKIGQALNPPLSRESVYRRAIKDVGQCTMVVVRKDAVQAFSKAYSSNGIGWFVEQVGELPGGEYVELIAYYGSSSYTAREMATLIDYLLDEAEQMELPIARERREAERAKEDWAEQILRKGVKKHEQIF